MKCKLILFTVTFTLVILSNLFPDNIITRTRNMEFIGARPLAMGETFLAVADDINAIYWNPSGLPAMDHLGVNSMNSNLFNSGVGVNYLALCIPTLPRTSIGVDWMNIGFNDDELEFSKNKFNFSGGYKLLNWISLGFNVKYIRMTAALDNMSQGTYYGWGADFGMLCKLHPKLKVGMVVHDFTDTHLKEIAGPVYEQNLRVGAAYQIFDNLLVAADVDDRFHFGSEWWPFKSVLALRAGIQQDFYTDENITLSYGMGCDIPIWGQRVRFDYAFTDTPTLPNTHRTSLSFLIDLFPRVVKIKKVELQPVYASLYKSYAKKPIGSVYVDHSGENDLDCTLSVSIDKYSKEIREDIVLPAKSVQEIDIHAVFDEAILEEPNNIQLMADVTISYMSGNRPKREPATERITLFRRNAINWGSGAEQAVAFITPEDPIVDQFARRALSNQNDDEQYQIKCEQLTKSIRLFNSIAHYGIRYQEDSYSPYSARYQAFDNIYYPAQLLQSKHGDCDDLCVLFASILENRNIPTALVSVPGHIFILLNTGLHERRSFQLCCAENNYVIEDNQIWIPLETTWIDKSFAEAWQKGVEIFNQFTEDEKHIINVRNAWEFYEPVAYTAKFVKPIRLYPQNQIAQDKEEIQYKSKQYLSETEKRVAQFPDSVDLRNRLAITYAFQDQPDFAKNHFQTILAKDSSNYYALNNLGNVLFLKGNLDSAQYLYQQALKHATADQKDGVFLNLGLLYSAADFEDMAVGCFEQVMDDSTDYKKVCDLLGITYLYDDLAKAEELKKTKKVDKKKVSKLSNKAMKKKGKKSKPPKEKLVNLGSKGQKPADEIENIFYWAF